MMQTQTHLHLTITEGISNLNTQYFQRPEGALAYTDYGGSGELVLMLPGMGALRSEYRFLAPILRREGYRPVAVDLRGQGDSSVPWQIYDVPSVGNDILALLEHLDSGPAHVIATSFSPAPAVWAAVERPESVDSLVLINPFVRDMNSSPLMKGMIWFMLNNPWRVKTWLMFYRTLYPTSKPADFEAYLAELSANLSEPGRFKALQAFSNASRRPAEERLPDIKAPTLVIMGTRDPDFPKPAEEGRLLAQKTGGELALIEGAGHYPQTELPNRTAREILNFLRKAR
jgi:pimeloyl-ACP methyl ester carboxylesterase